MKLSTKVLAVAAFLALSSGAAYAAEATGMMDCCKTCACCKDKPAAPPASDHH